MAVISDMDRNPFENLCKGVHDFNDDELGRLHEASVEVKAILQSAHDREQKNMAARDQLRQMGSWS
jgi:hypothetical protein